MQGPAELQIRQGADWVEDHDGAVVQDLSEFAGRRGAVALPQPSLAAQISRIQGPEHSMEAAPRQPQFVRNVNLQQADRS